MGLYALQRLQYFLNGKVLDAPSEAFNALYLFSLESSASGVAVLGTAPGSVNIAVVGNRYIVHCK
jgi:hypothetical protein